MPESYRMYNIPVCEEISYKEYVNWLLSKKHYGKSKRRCRT